MSDNKTDFGFKRVNREEKAGLVKEIFSNVAKKYDLMNDLMSAGIHRIWKNKMVEEINFNRSDLKFIDVAGGTGDIAFRIAKKLRNINTPKHYEDSPHTSLPKDCKNPLIEIVDINQEMLDEGKSRAVDYNLFPFVNFTCADGENLPFADNSFDYFTIAFGIRNFTNIDKGLREAHRVLKPNGKFICLEFSAVNNYFLQKFYDAYSFNIIPQIGKIILDDKNSYQYLVESIRKFPSQEKFKKMIEDSGFKNVHYKNQTGGAAAIHSGVK